MTLTPLESKIELEIEIVMLEKAEVISSAFLGFPFL